MDEGLWSLILLAGILFISAWRLYQKKFCNITALFVLFYALSAVGSIGFYVINSYVPFYDYDQITFWPYLYWLILFAITLMPIYNYEKERKTIIKYNIKLINVICIIGLILSIIPFVELLPEVKGLFGGGGTENVADAITDIHDEDEKEESLSLLGHYLMRGVWFLYDLSFILIYPLLKEKKKNPIAILGVIMVILTKNLQTISTVSRTGLFTLVFHAFVCIFLFWPFLTSNESRKLKKIGGFFIAFFVFVFLVITIARGTTYEEKSQRGEYTTSVFVLRYAGEGFCNFGNFAFYAKRPLGGIQTLYVPQKLLGMDPPFVDRDYLYNKAESLQGIPQNVFYTFIGGWVLDLGAIWGALLLIIIAFIARMLFRPSNLILSLSTMFLFSTYLKIIEFGTIGYVYANKNSEFLLVYLFLFLIMKRFKS